MEIIKKLSKHIHCEYEDAHKYIECALKMKTDYPEIAKLMYDLSLQEVKHAEMLHEKVVSLIEEKKKNDVAVPAEMLALYNYVHEEEIEMATEVGVLQTMYEKGK